MTLKCMAGIVLSIVGVALLLVGLNASHSVADRVSQFFTGRLTHATLWFIIAGTACTAIGLLLVQFSGRCKSAVIIATKA